MLKIILMIIVSVIVLVVIVFIFLGYQSKTGKAGGLIEGQLSRCPDKPNCVCSEYPQDQQHFITPVRSSMSPERLLQQAVTIIDSMDGTVNHQNDNYITATFTSGIFGFVDDFEVRIDVQQQLLHIRSASRVGHSDLGANAKRVELFKQHMH